MFYNVIYNVIYNIFKWAVGNVMTLNPVVPVFALCHLPCVNLDHLATLTKDVDFCIFLVLYLML